MITLIKRGFHKQWNYSDFTPMIQPGLRYSRYIGVCLDKGHARLFKPIGSLDSSANEPIEGMVFLFRFGTYCI